MASLSSSMCDEELRLNLFTLFYFIFYFSGIVFIINYKKKRLKIHYFFSKISCKRNVVEITGSLSSMEQMLCERLRGALFNKLPYIKDFLEWGMMGHIVHFVITF